MPLVIKAQDVSFSTIGNIHSTPINVKSQVVLKLVSLVTLWILRCRGFSQVRGERRWDHGGLGPKSKRRS